MSRVYPQLRTVRELLGAKYALDFYQREFQWGEDNIEQLFNDFENSFTSSFDISHERKRVAEYPHYYLGTIITVTEGAMKNIVDGQQRLTTLTLLLIYLHHELKNYQDSDEQRADLQRLIFSVRHGEKSFNIDVPERNDCLQALYELGNYEPVNNKDLSVRNLIDRYDDITVQYPEQLAGDVLPFFVDWLIDNVDLVEIEASTDDAAFTIFETMNDRGVNLSHADMLKGYLLGNINEKSEEFEHSKKSEANTLWRERIFRLIDIGKEKEADFFKDWLRAQYAETMREGKKGSKNRDFEKIDKFHRWVRDERKRIGLINSTDYYDFVMKRFNRFSDLYINMLTAAGNFSKDYEFIYFNAHNNFTFQYALMLAPLRVEDDADTINRKLRLVSGFIDIFIARRMVNFRTLAYSSIKYTIFNIIKDIRDQDVYKLATILREKVLEMTDSFDAVDDFYLHGQNKKRIHHMLARITYFIERECGIESSFDTYVSRQISKPFEVEHLWANKFERYDTEFKSENDFQHFRNLFGGLILLPKGYNQSLNADTYEEKIDHYLKPNMLDKSLHPLAYEKDPSFRNFVEKYNLPFEPHYPSFQKEDLIKRQELYKQICEIIWSPARFEKELI